ncbi:uncharacterized protein B0H18DRAFT_456347 [Fomitopsis serialis]|uniref:uncharacterized protein n=1 Tax=Fomitopsis serialis TaxID=139415 RepID=UPI0020072DEB|nr:uncharacterized protein B0H18DRAFT_456347 [Neoantrodia serialis]KAH9923603.1 hypothetical protein B0H18DRAFT_456347 [Neoantrodia serialis]
MRDRFIDGRRRRALSHRCPPSVVHLRRSRPLAVTHPRATDTDSARSSGLPPLPHAGHCRGPRSHSLTTMLPP